MSPLADFLAWLSRRRAERAIRAAERSRAAIMAQKANRKARHQAFRYLDGDLRQATNASLRAFVGGR